MEENSPRVSRKAGVGGSSSGGGGGGARKSRYAVEERGDVECSGKYCRSCTAGVIADCVALCCCPCALLNLLTFTFVKVPWKMGRRCLGLGKKNTKKLEMKRKCKKNCCCCCDLSSSKSGSRHCNRTLGESVWVEEEIWDFSTKFRDDEEEREDFSARFEAEKVWLELYEVGQLGFGRISFTST